MAKTDWWNALKKVTDAAAPPASARREYLDANLASVEQLIRGIGPDDTVPSEGAGACIVVNMAARHVPDFCERSRSGDQHPYKNAYRLRKVGAKRQSVDDAIVAACEAHGIHLSKEEICFAAVETNGAGVRFFGDMCLVLRFRPTWLLPDARPSDGGDFANQELRVLERNSYDVARAPVSARVAATGVAGSGQEQVRAEHIGEWLGSWERDLVPMLAARIVQELPAVERRWTSGQIARAVLDDEDYCEVLYPQSFGAAELAEVRVSAADVAAETDIANREAAGEAPAAHELEWREQRRAARRALHAEGIPLRVVASHARRRGS